MKPVNLILSIVLFSNMLISCSAQQKKENVNAISTNDGVQVSYFHYTHRCATCNAVESVSRDAIAEMYGDKVSFADYNLDEEAGEAMGKELGIAGQTLLIVSGETKINITNEGFMNALNNPDKLKAIIKEKIDPLL